jgi:hypothetical protein
MEPDSHMDKVQKRLQRFEEEGTPVTVWQVEYLEKVDSSGRNPVSTELHPRDFHALRILGPLSPHDPTIPGFFAEECRACAGRFTFRTNKATATILTGKPAGVRYKAISYVWGDVQSLRIYCKCGEKKSIPISSPDRFRALLSLAATASDCAGVWLDAISIDQDSDADKKVQLAAMGDIYEHAESVLVLLPKADQLLFDCLMDLKASALLQDGMGLLDFEFATFNTSHAALIDVFISKFEEYKRSLAWGIYFQRAWTFQEWALARDVEVACENMKSDEGCLKLVPQVKSSVIRATVRLAMHRRLKGHAGVKFKVADPDVPAFVDDVKSLFPQEHVFCSSEEIDWDERVMDTVVPHTGMNHQLGLRLVGKFVSFPHPSIHPIVLTFL